MVILSQRHGDLQEIPDLSSTRLFNHIKETLWRMIYNGVRSPARLHSGYPCHWCHAPTPDTKHIYSLGMPRDSDLHLDSPMR